MNGNKRLDFERHLCKIIDATVHGVEVWCQMRLDVVQKLYNVTEKF